MSRKEVSEMEAPKKEDLVFHVALRRCTVMVEPDYGNWDGGDDGERVEQVLYARLNISEFCQLLTQYQFDSIGNTQGLGTEGGYILPARVMDEGSGYDGGGSDTTCYVCVCTKEIYERAVRDADKPDDVPVLQNDFTIKPEKLSFIEPDAFFDATLKVMDDMIPLCDVGVLGMYPDDDDVESELYKRICASLLAVEV